jgi:hypothetical protein
MLYFIALTPTKYFFIGKEKTLEQCKHIFKKFLKNETWGINPTEKKEQGSCKNRTIKKKQ